MATQTNAKIICDSISPAGHRLTTFECTFPRIILAEVNTHRFLSRNSASSRAIPIEKMIKRVLDDPYAPTYWGKNQKGMQAAEELSEENDGYEPIGDKPDRAMQATSPRWRARGGWYEASRSAVDHAKRLLEIGLHKQITNRLLEPFMWHVALVTGTEFANLFNLRDNKDAHPDFRDLAHAMRELYEKGKPIKQDWHTPLALDEDLDGLSVVEGIVDWDELRCKVSVGRCARVSYLTHDGKRDPQADIDLCERLLKSGHMSPFEHVARPMTEYELDLFKQKKLVLVDGRWIWRGDDFNRETGTASNWYTHFLGNIQGWVQYRKLVPHEDDILGAR